MSGNVLQLHHWTDIISISLLLCICPLLLLLCNPFNDPMSGVLILLHLILFISLAIAQWVEQEHPSTIRKSQSVILRTDCLLGTCSSAPEHTSHRRRHSIGDTTSRHRPLGVCKCRSRSKRSSKGPFACEWHCLLSSV